MQGIKERTQKLFYQFSLEEYVPQDHTYRRIEQTLNLRFLYKRTEAYYGSQGQKSIDPVVFFKICLLGYLNNITSDRALIRFCNDSLAARWYIGYDIDQHLPVHSTLSRTRQLFGSDVYEQVFLEILGLCVDAGLVQGYRQVVDSALIKANAHIDSMQRRQLLEDASSYCQQVDKDNSEEGASGHHVPDSKEAPLQAVDTPAHEHGKPKRDYSSNETHRCSSDPDARMASKPNKPKGMYYHSQVCVDSQYGVVTAAFGDYGDRKDQHSYLRLLLDARRNLAGFSLPIREVLADAGYNTAKNIALSERLGITAYMPNPSGYAPTRAGFHYDQEHDRYVCSQGEYVTFRSFSKTGRKTKKVYRTSTSQCKNCPLAAECITSKQGYKEIGHAVGKPWYDLMHARLSTRYGEQLLRKRKGIVEPALGNLIHHYGMRKVYARGIEAADKHVVMACMVMNLKKLLKVTFRHVKKPNTGHFLGDLCAIIANLVPQKNLNIPSWLFLSSNRTIYHFSVVK